MRETTSVLINTAVEDVCRSFDQRYLRTRFKNCSLLTSFRVNEKHTDKLSSLYIYYVLYSLNIL
jgi:hypothetical protein